MSLLDVLDPVQSVDVDEANVTDVHTDRAWLCDEAAAWERRAASGEYRPADLATFVASILSQRVGSMAFHRHESVASYVADRWTCCRRVDLDRLPTLPTRRVSALAAALDVEAAWYLHLDTPAAQLAAWSLRQVADQADEFGAADVDDFVGLEAAYHMAMQEVLAELHDHDRDAFEPWTL